MHARLHLALFVAGCLLAGLARAGEFGIPCEAGRSSPSGFEPCTLCEPGTFANFIGSVLCEPCPGLTYTTQFGASTCDQCACNDHTACTLDGCDPDSGQCSAEPVVSCELVSVRFEGTVTGFYSNAVVPVAALGMSIKGSYALDPLTPDADAVDPAAGWYQGAIQSLEMRVGAAPAVEVLAVGGQVGISNDDQFYADSYFLVAFPGSVVTPAAYTYDQFTLQLFGDGQNPFASDDLPLTSLDPTAFGQAALELKLLDESGLTSISSDDFTMLVPEPEANALACIAAAALVALRRATSR